MQPAEQQRAEAGQAVANALHEAGIGADVVHKLVEHQSPNVLDLMKEGSIKLVVNTPSSLVARADEINAGAVPGRGSIPPA